MKEINKIVSETVCLDLPAVADPGFPIRRGASPNGENSNLMAGPISPQNYMQMKEIGLR